MKASACLTRVPDSDVMAEINLNRLRKMDIPNKNAKAVNKTIKTHKQMHKLLRKYYYDEIIHVSPTHISMKGYSNHLIPHMIAYRRVRYRGDVKEGQTYAVIDEKYKLSKEDLRHAVYDGNKSSIKYNMNSGNKPIIKPSKKSWLRMCEYCDNFVQYREPICCRCGALPSHDKGVIKDTLKVIEEPGCRTKYTEFTLKTFMENKMKKKSARTIQCTYRMHRQRMEYKLAIAAIITIQKCWRRKKVYIKLHKVMELKKQMLALMFN